MSNPTDEDWKRMSKLVDTFYQRADAEPFRVPVDWKGFGTFVVTAQSYSTWIWTSVNFLSLEMSSL
jgi:hypothetical protein